MQKILNSVICVGMVGVLGALVYVAFVIGPPQEVLSHDAQQFKAFEAAYITAHESYRLAKFEKEVKDERVIWEGNVRDISNTGTFFDIVPVQYSGTGGSNAPWLECAVFLPEGVYIPTDLKKCQRVRVTGLISSVGEHRTVIIRDAKITAQWPSNGKR